MIPIPIMITKTDSGTIDLGSLEDRHCEACLRQTAHHLILRYTYWALFMVFGVVFKRQYFLACSACGDNWELNEPPATIKLTRTSIPFMHRAGIFLAPVPIAAIIWLLELEISPWIISAGLLVIIAAYAGVQYFRGRPL
jgi:hypothetical protein